MKEEVSQNGVKLLRASTREIETKSNFYAIYMLRGWRAHVTRIVRTSIYAGVYARKQASQ